MFRWYLPTYSKLHSRCSPNIETYFPAGRDCKILKVQHNICPISPTTYCVQICQYSNRSTKIWLRPKIRQNIYLHAGGWLWVPGLNGQRCWPRGRVIYQVNFTSQRNPAHLWKYSTASHQSQMWSAGRSATEQNTKTQQRAVQRKIKNISKN